jgi:hypothetical protein
MLRVGMEEHRAFPDFYATEVRLLWLRCKQLATQDRGHFERCHIEVIGQRDTAIAYQVTPIHRGFAYPYVNFVAY